MASDVPNVEELKSLLLALYGNALPEDDLSRGGDAYKRQTALAGGIVGLHAHIATVDDDVMVDRCDGERQDRFGTIYKLPRKGGAQASAESAGLVQGTAASSWTTSDALVAPNGERYFPTAGGSLPGSGSSLIGVRSEDGGLSTNLDAGTVLTWESTPAGLEDEVELQVALTGGRDAEKNGAYRARLLNRVGEGAKGGTANDWEQWALAGLDSIATAYVFPDRNGLGSVDVAALKSGTGSARTLDSSERAELLAYLDTVRPVSAQARVLETTTESQSIEIHLTPKADAQFARDWNDSTPPEISTWTAATKTIQFTADRPSSMQAGHRFVIEGSSGAELEIESLSGTDSIVVADVGSITPTVGQNVYSGGPLITPARDAVLALIDSLGPRVGDFGVGNWESTLQVWALQNAAAVEGVLKPTPVTPSADVEPTAETYPDDDTINFLVPGNVLVRYVDL